MAILVSLLYIGFVIFLLIGGAYLELIIGIILGDKWALHNHGSLCEKPHPKYPVYGQDYFYKKH